jgi:deaminated glutathione amidase
MRVALLQLTVTDDPGENLPITVTMIRQAVAEGAEFILTPECTNMLSSSRAHLNDTLHHEGTDPTLSVLRDQAAHAGVWLLAGSG